MYRKRAKMFEELRNKIDFFIRNNTKFSRKNFVEKDEILLKINERENLYIQDILEQFFSKRIKRNTYVLDIGSKNWFYAKGEYNFFKSFCKEIYLDGVELDAYRLYSNFYSRYEVAKYFTSGLENTRYIVGNVLDINKKYDYIIWILPFVVIDPLIRWGLPRKYFCPEKLLSHAYKILNKDGQMLIINQGEEEKEEQKELLEILNIPYEYKGKVKSRFYDYKRERFAYLINK